MEHLSLSLTIDNFNSLSYDKHKEWLDNLLKLNKQTSHFFFIHLNNFLNKFESKLGMEKFSYLEMQFYYSLDLKLIDWSRCILQLFIKEFSSKESKVQLMQADFLQVIDNGNGSHIKEALTKYKKLIFTNENDLKSLKKYLLLMKSSIGYDNLKNYIELLNEYLKVYMDDAEIWQELGNVYVETVNYNRAIFCYEEVLLHSPNNYLLYIKIGDLLNSYNNTDSSSQALKYYAKSILIEPTPKAFWGIMFVANIFTKYKKQYDNQLISLVKISKEKLKEYYSFMSRDYIDSVYETDENQGR